MKIVGGNYEYCVLVLLMWVLNLSLLWNFNDNNVEASHHLSSLAYDELDVSAAHEVPDDHNPHRTAYHFQPTKHWLNGPMYYKGIYHIFYQYNPKGAVWGNIVWAHSVSKDLINWKAVEHAIYPTDSFDKYGCWTGSATILPAGNKPVILYTGVVDKDMKVQVQNYAIPANLSDPYLRKWIKPKDNPLLVADGDVNETAFRDPTTAWMGKDGHWRILIGSRIRERGIAYLYKSKNFKKWTKAKHPLHSATNTGNWECPDFFPVVSESEMNQIIFNKNISTEEIVVPNNNNKHVLKVSLDNTRYEYYTIGKYYTDYNYKETDKYIPDKNMIDGWNGLRYDYGNFYASKSFVDSNNQKMINGRRIVWAWVNESDTEFDDVRKGWAGIMAIPRTVWLHSNGKQLLLWPIKELETLRGKKVSLSGKKLQKGDNLQIKGITAAQADIEVTFSFPSLDKAEEIDVKEESKLDAQRLCSEKGSSVQGGLGPFGLLVLASNKLEEYTPVFFRVFKNKTNHHHHFVLMCSDASSSSLEKGLYKPSFAAFLNLDLTNKKTLSLRTLIDHSVVESFGEGGEVCITSRVYPTLAIFEKARLFAFNNGTETITIHNLHAWSMRSPQLMN